MSNASIRQGDTFSVRSRIERGRVDTYRREADDEAPVFACERMRVSHLTCSVEPKMRPYTFPAESAWFLQRGLQVAP